MTITQELDKVGQKKAKGEASNEAARKRIFNQFLGSEEPEKQAYADPAAFFN